MPKLVSAVAQPEESGTQLQAHAIAQLIDHIKTPRLVNALLAQLQEFGILLLALATANQEDSLMPPQACVVAHQLCQMNGMVNACHAQLQEPGMLVLANASAQLEELGTQCKTNAAAQQVHQSNGTINASLAQLQDSGMLLLVSAVAHQDRL